MSLLKKIIPTSILFLFFAANLLANGCCGPQKQLEIRFSLFGIEGIYNNQFLGFGNFVAFENGVKVDHGFFTDVDEPLSAGSNICDANSWNNRQTVRLYGENGIATFIVRGKTLLEKNNTLKFVNGSGVYQGLTCSNNVPVIVDCNAQKNQFILDANVKTQKPPCNCQ